MRVWLGFLLLALAACAAPAPKTVTVPADRCADVVRELAARGDGFAVTCVPAAGGAGTVMSGSSGPAAPAATEPGTAYRLPDGSVYH